MISLSLFILFVSFVEIVVFVEPDWSAQALPKVVSAARRYYYWRGAQENFR